MEWKNIYRGLVMGISDLIPGVSGGTIAVVLGIYDRLLAAISGFFSKEWKKHLGFLIPLAVGMGSALLLLSRVIEYLLEHYYGPTQFFFMGLIVGVLPFILRKAEARTRFKTVHIVVLLVAAGLLALTAFLRTDEAIEPITALTGGTAIRLFFSGWLASMAMLLPGISGSFVLLILGAYSTAIAALSSMNISIIAVIGLGAVVGFIVSSRLIRYLLDVFPSVTYAVITGLILGSLVVIFPGVPAGIGLLAVSAGTFVAGLLIAVLLGRRE
ncbi:MULTISPECIES: DUF368 domain-containing protein [Paenibacillus]|uniref:DUF368 domain-containing protein n=1 Tax=Paenibacillus campinasensis TaxID=66347 RepID=A0A268EFR9_9BACL|nr:MULTISPECIES: DUF368 domain-containing protein [Paenibacillus]MUG67209.1 DUF368 domain-containing protein [Paenibacillus campinasensis]PAD71977.1 DUF368 domain-containing protein [Paenibacillus campinasensis]PAK48150.1 DUF368 domain-containing protein [Paenibacillus sp. 7541]